MSKRDKKEVLLDVKRAFVIAKALNYQYIHIREHLSPELKKAVNEAKSRNSYFIKKIEESFDKKRVEKTFLEAEDELSFQLLEKLEEIKNSITHVNQQNLSPSQDIK